MAEPKSHTEWQKTNTTMVSIRLHNKLDSDILEALQGKQKQTEIKRLLRFALQSEKQK